MRKIRLSYKSFKTLGEGITLGILESRLAALEKNGEKFEENDREMQSIKEPDDSQREYFTKNLFEMAENAFIDVRGQYWENRSWLAQGS